MAKIRVYELARELNKDNRSLEEVIRDLGIPIKNYMSTLTPDEAERVRSAVDGSSSSSSSSSVRNKPPRGRGDGPKRSGSAKTVIRRRGAEVKRRRAERAEAEEAAARAAGVDERGVVERAEQHHEVRTRSEVVTRRVVPTAVRGPGEVRSVDGEPPASDRTMGATRNGTRQDAVAHARGGATLDERTPAAAQHPSAMQQRSVSPAAVPRPTNPQMQPVGASQPVSARHPAPPESSGAQRSQPRAESQRSPTQEPVQDQVPSSEKSEARGPAVGTRIELPKGSRQLPGGMAARMGGPPPRQPAAPSHGRGPAAHGGVPHAQSRGPSSQGQSQTRRSDAGRGLEAAGQLGSVSERNADSSIATAKVSKEPAGARRVVRNAAGVIVGAASERSEPKILGFIPLAQNRKRQQVIITDATEEDRKGRASQRKQREERAQAQGRRRKMTRKGKGGLSSAPRVSTAEMSEEKKRIRIDEAIQVSDLAHQMGQKASVVLRQLWSMGMRGITINNAIDYETAELVASEFGYTVEDVAFQEGEILEAESKGDGDTRAPVVTMMGHVDHGKTSLLDFIRESRVAAGEAGGITQHIGAYKVKTRRGEVVFLDTPGHEAFTAMRSRGAEVTDVVVLVVAADDGVMPTTIEAIKHAKDAKTPIVVAINKMDKPEANPGRVKQALMEQGIVGEEFGGDTPIVELSAKTGMGVDELLETLAVQAEVMELRAAPMGRGRGVVLEARIDKGRGTVATVLVQAGIIRKGDIVVANEYSGKVRGLYDHLGKSLKEAGPSTPVEVLGLSGVPAAGDPVNVVESERDAKVLVAHRREQRKRKESVRTGPSIQELLQRKRTPVLKVVLRADVQGSAQALKDSLEGLSTEKAKVEVIKAEVGQINETDVKYARAGEAVIFGFNVKTTGKAAPVADAEGVPIHTFSVIYDAVERTKELMIGMLEPEYREREQGEAEVRALFPIPRLGVVAGCRVTKGLIQRHSHVRVVRGGEVIYNGTIGSLRVFKEDVREVKDGFECGIVVDGFAQIQEGDRIQAYEVEAIPPTL